MSTEFLADAPAETIQRLEGLEDSELLSFFRALPWSRFIKRHIADLSTAAA